MTPELHLNLQPGQLAALETRRGTGDLSFEFVASGTDNDENGEQHVHGDWRIRVSRSDWIEKTTQCGCPKLMLLEVSLPLEGNTLTRESAGGMSARPPREPPINEIIKRILQLQPLHTPENTPPMQQRASSGEILDDGVGATALPLRFGMTIHVGQRIYTGYT